MDTRKTRGDKPLRKSWQLLFLSGPSTKLESAKNPEKVYSLYEAQISVAVTGIDDSVWTAYGFVDTYFGSKESVGRYHELKGRRGLGRADPFARGQLDATRPIWMPREYFLKILQIRIKDILREWQRIADKVEEAVKRYVGNSLPKPACFFHSKGATNTSVILRSTCVGFPTGSSPSGRIINWRRLTDTCSGLGQTIFCHYPPKKKPDKKCETSSHGTVRW